MFRFVSSAWNWRPRRSVNPFSSRDWGSARGRQGMPGIATLCGTSVDNDAAMSRRDPCFLFLVSSRAYLPHSSVCVCSQVHVALAECSELRCGFPAALHSVDPAVTPGLANSEPIMSTYAGSRMCGPSCLRCWSALRR